MAKRVAYILGAVVVLGFVYYVYTAAAAAVAAGASSFFPGFGSDPAQPEAAGGLSVVDFSIFAKGGKGWDYITQGYGDTPYAYLYLNHWHNGIDIGADYGVPIYSPIDNGIIVATGDQDNYCPHLAFGKFVIEADTAHDVVLLFAHLDQILVSPGETVKKTNEIATVGTTGLETGPHLHFSVFELAGFSLAPAHGCGPYPQGHDIDPVPYLQSVG